LVGRGIVEPVDDFRVTNPPGNPELLDALAADFVAHGYDLRRLVRNVVGSNTYQRSSRAVDGNRGDDRFFSHAFVKPLPSQVLADAIAEATGVGDVYPGHPAGTRAVQLLDGRAPSYTLDVLGRCTRDVSCEADARGGGLSQALHLINGAAVNEKLRGGVVERLLREEQSVAEIVEELYLRTFARFPDDAEREHFEQVLVRASTRRDAVEDLLWALLNSREFVFNH
jgi:hypothetical protein